MKKEEMLAFTVTKTGLLIPKGETLVQSKKAEQSGIKGLINLKYATITKTFQSYIEFKAYLKQLEEEGNKPISFMVQPLFD
jgi:hypothetical protein